MADPAGTKVLYEVRDEIALITLNRPEVLNAMDLEVFLGLVERAAQAEADAAVRAIVVCGQGRAFSSGLDTSLFAVLAQGGTDAAVEGLDIGRLQESFSVFERSAKPTIAAVRGPALGGGLQLAIACDLRVGGTDLRLSAAEIRWGIIPDLGAIHRLPRLIGLGRAKEMVLTGRDLTAEEALAWGLVNEVVAPEEVVARAIFLAGQLASHPPLTIAGAKGLLNAALDHTVADGLAKEIEVQHSVLGSDDFREAVMARLSKREPRYQGK